MATSYDLMLILNGSDRETAEVVSSFKDFLKNWKKDGFKFTKNNIKEVIDDIESIDNGDKRTYFIEEKEDGKKYDTIEFVPDLEHKYDWESDDGFEVEGYIAKHCDCREMEKCGGCDCDAC